MEAFTSFVRDGCRISQGKNPSVFVGNGVSATCYVFVGNGVSATCDTPRNGVWKVTHNVIST